MNCAIVDIGSNTIRLIIYKIENGREKSIFDKKYTVGLITYVVNGALSDKGIKKLIRTLDSIKNIVDLVSCNYFYPFATASLRNLSNRDNILKEVREKLNFEIDVLSQEEEARIGNIGILEGIDVKSGLTIDIGGASTEIVSFKDSKPVEFINLQIGSLVLFSKFVSVVIPKKREIREIQREVNREWDSKAFNDSYKNLIGIGGTIRACGKVIAELWGNDEKNFTLRDCISLLVNISDRDRETIRTIIKVNPSRTHTLVPGLIILITACQKLNISEVQVSDSGLREGYLKLKILRVIK